MSTLNIQEFPIEALRPFEHNARTLSRKQIKQIAKSIQQFGFVNPVLIDSENRIIAGHGRVEAARSLGMVDVPTICLGHLTESEKRAYIIADNRLAELAGWDREILAIEFQHLSDIDLEFDIELTGFELAEIEIMIDPPSETEEESPVPDPPDASVAKEEAQALTAQAPD
jgi:ParB-like chromosome segregation protein Spo0J